MGAVLCWRTGRGTSASAAATRCSTAGGAAHGYQQGMSSMLQLETMCTASSICVRLDLALLVTTLMHLCRPGSGLAHVEQPPLARGVGAPLRQLLQPRRRRLQPAVAQLADACRMRDALRICRKSQGGPTMWGQSRRGRAHAARLAAQQWMLSLQSGWRRGVGSASVRAHLRAPRLGHSDRASWRRLAARPTVCWRTLRMRMWRDTQAAAHLSRTLHLVVRRRYDVGSAARAGVGDTGAGHRKACDCSSLISGTCGAG